MVEMSEKFDFSERSLGVLQIFKGFADLLDCDLRIRQIISCRTVPEKKKTNSSNDEKKVLKWNTQKACALLLLLLLLLLLFLKCWVRTRQLRTLRIQWVSTECSEAGVRIEFQQEGTSGTFPLMFVQEFGECVLGWLPFSAGELVAEGQFERLANAQLRRLVARRVATKNGRKRER
jgi:hypothetical protein